MARLRTIFNEPEVFSNPVDERSRVEMWRGDDRVGELRLAGGFHLVPGPHSDPWLRFHIPLIEPDGRISRIRLSDKASRFRSREAGCSVRKAYQSEFIVEVFGREA